MLEVYEELQEDAKEISRWLWKKAREAGVGDVVTVVELGNPKTLLATEIPDEQKGWLNWLEQQVSDALSLLVGSSSEYILRHAKVDSLQCPW